ncbi:MAG: zf-TFIIB domain-containing protein [Deltaproteobacteria bacterium]|nr:zf-TFIIB domain-containing protein [Deltaproteobacteria bacterium]
MESPYREAPQMLLCPRCAEALDRVFGGVAVCVGCQGAWISQSALDVAFGNPRWPAGRNMWWHAALDCPECATEGTVTRMDARSADAIMVDLCPSHGVWLDHGELARLMKLEAGADELLALQRKVNAVPDPDGLAQRRLRWRTELDKRRRQTAEFRAWLEMAAQRKAAEAAEAERLRAIEDEKRRQVREAQAASAAEIARVAEEKRQAELARHQRLMKQRAEIAASMNVLVREREAARGHLASVESQFAQHEKALSEIDKELDAPKPNPK